MWALAFTSVQKGKSQQSLWILFEQGWRHCCCFYQLRDLTLDTDQTCNYFMGFVFPCIMILILSCQTRWAAFMWLPEILGKTRSCLPQRDCWWSLTKKSSCWANQQNSVRWQRLPKIESDWGCFKLTVGLDVSLCCSWGSKVIQGSLLRTTVAPEGMWWAALFVKDFLGFAFKADVLKDLFWGNCIHY